MGAASYTRATERSERERRRGRWVMTLVFRTITAGRLDLVFVGMLDENGESCISRSVSVHDAAHGFDTHCREEGGRR